jgi:hypothetical protein
VEGNTEKIIEPLIGSRLVHHKFHAVFDTEAPTALILRFSPRIYKYQLNVMNCTFQTSFREVFFFLEDYMKVSFRLQNTQLISSLRFLKEVVQSLHVGYFSGVYQAIFTSCLSPTLVMSHFVFGYLPSKHRFCSHVECSTSLNSVE